MMSDQNSKRLQQEIKYWTNIISSHKKSLSHIPPDKNKCKSKAYSWSRAMSSTSPSAKDLQYSNTFAKRNKISTRLLATSKSIPSSSRLHVSISHMQKSAKETTSSSTSKYKWKNSSSNSNLKPANVDSSLDRNKILVPKRNVAAKPVVIKKHKISRPPPKLSATDKVRPNFSHSLAKNTTLFKWSKSCKNTAIPPNSSCKPKAVNPGVTLLTTTSLHREKKVFTSAKKVTIQRNHVNTRHRYRKLNTSADKRLRRLPSSNSLVVSNYILSKYKLRKTTQLSRRLSVNVSKNPFKVIKMGPSPPPRRKLLFKGNSSRFHRATLDRRGRGFASKYIEPRYHYNNHINSYRRKNALRKLNDTPITKTRFKLIRSKATNHKFGNITWKRKQSYDSSRKTSHVSKLVNHQTLTARQRMASVVLQKSLETARAKNRHKLQKVYCIFFNRFGKCNRGEKCPYAHDPDRVAICTQFLRGTCRNENCPFSHKTSKHKMPVCSFFLRGKCSAINCPYLHVFLGHDAPVCKNFATTGYCSKADNCKKVHIRACPEFYDKGVCSRADQCNLPHRRKAARSQRGGNSIAKESSTRKSQLRKLNNVETAAFVGSDYIRLPQSSALNNAAVETAPSGQIVPSVMRIHPQLKTKKT